MAIQYFDGRKTVASAGTAEAISSTSQPFTRLDIVAEADNTGVIAVGTTPIATLATREGIYLNAGDSYTIESLKNGEVHDLANIKIDASVSTDGITYFGYFEKWV